VKALTDAHLIEVARRSWLNTVVIEDTISISVIRDAKNEDRSAKEEMVHTFQPVLFYMADCHLRTPEMISQAVRKTLRDLLGMLADTEDLSSFEERAMSLSIRNFLNAALREDTARSAFSAVGSDPAENTVVYTAADERREPVTEFTEKECMNLMTHLLKQLPDDQRMVFVMHYLDRLPFQKIAAMIRVPEDTLKRRAQLAKNRLSVLSHRSIPTLFGIIDLAEANKHLILNEADSTHQEPAEEVLLSEEKTAGPSEASGDIPDAETARKAEKAPGPLRYVIGGITAAGVIGALAGFTWMRKPEQVSLLANAHAVFTGFDGAGSAAVLYSDSSVPAVNEILRSASCQLVDRDGSVTEKDSLHNGDQLTYACTFDEELLKKASLIPAETSIDVTVEGLREPETVDLFQGVSLETASDQDSGKMIHEVAVEKPAADGVSYEIVSESDDAVHVRAKVSEKTLLKEGKKAESLEHVFTGSEVPPLNRASEFTRMIEQGLLNAAPAYDEFGNEAANGSDPEINSLAQRFLGMGGACTAVARAFIQELYGVDIGNASRNLYAVEAPEPGDLVKYYDSYGNFTHVATYIGNGLVLNGNYNGSTHITSINDSLYAENGVTYHRVSR